MGTSYLTAKGDFMLQLNVGSLDGREMIRMNNLAVGYFPSESPEIGVYPPPQPETLPNPPQVQPEPDSQTNF
jgi:hypothetical protein